MRCRRHRNLSLYGSEGFKGSPFLDMAIRACAPTSPAASGVCADAIATLEGIDREAIDDLAYVSQQRAKNAIENGHFDKALVPVTAKISLALDKEEFPRPQTTRDDLRALDPLFAKLADFPLDEEGTTFKLVNQAYPDLEINPSTTRATHQVSSMVPRRYF